MKVSEAKLILKLISYQLNVTIIHDFIDHIPHPTAADRSYHLNVSQHFLEHFFHHHWDQWEYWLRYHDKLGANWGWLSKRLCKCLDPWLCIIIIIISNPLNHVFDVLLWRFFFKIQNLSKLWDFFFVFPIVYIVHLKSNP